MMARVGYPLSKLLLGNKSKTKNKVMRQDPCYSCNVTDTGLRCVDERMGYEGNDGLRDHAEGVTNRIGILKLIEGIMYGIG